MEIPRIGDLSPVVVWPAMEYHHSLSRLPQSDNQAPPQHNPSHRAADLLDSDKTIDRKNHF
jgi:hypothetical protein